MKIKIGVPLVRALVPKQFAMRSMIRFQIILSLLLLIPGLSKAQNKHKRAFGDRMLLGLNYGLAEDFVGDRDNLYEVEHFTSLRAGVSLTQWMYAGIQSKFIRTRNFETPGQNFYMAGLWARCYLLHPALPESNNRMGVFLESGFMMGNYAYEDRNSVAYSFERPGSWYVPLFLGAEFRVWNKLTLEGGLNMIYNNGGSWDKQGIAYPSLGVNWHW